jgi:hypothetical protein
MFPESTSILIYSVSQCCFQPINENNNNYSNDIINNNHITNNENFFLLQVSLCRGLYPYLVTYHELYSEDKCKFLSICIRLCVF